MGVTVAVGVAVRVLVAVAVGVGVGVGVGGSTGNGRLKTSVQSVRPRSLQTFSPNLYQPPWPAGFSKGGKGMLPVWLPMACLNVAYIAGRYGLPSSG